MFVLALGAVTSVVGYIVKQRRERARAQVTSKPYVMVSNQKLFRGDGSPGLLVATIVRYRRSDGSFKQVTTNYESDGSVSEPAIMMGVADVGVYEVGTKQQQLSFQSEMHGALPVVDNEQNPAFSHNDVILGHKVQVCRWTQDNTFDEFSFAPELWGDPIKFVAASADGAYTVVEAVKIELREPTENEFGKIPNYPLNYSAFERRIERAEANGQHEQANELRQIEAKQKSP